MRRSPSTWSACPPHPISWRSACGTSEPIGTTQLVEGLLNSPHYGERWGRHWFDLARYADSDGYEKDSPRPHAWRWRNWVIDVHQPRSSLRPIFRSNSWLEIYCLRRSFRSGSPPVFIAIRLINREGGTDPEEDRVKRTVDRTNTLGKIWLGLTVECAQCHSHKYDPITQREYYGLYGFFNSLDEIDIGAPLPAERTAYLQAKKRVRRAARALRGGHRRSTNRSGLSRLSSSGSRWPPSCRQYGSY